MFIISVRGGHMPSFFFFRIIACTGSIAVTMTITYHTVSLPNDLLMFLVFQIWFYAQHPRDTYEGKQQQEHLDKSLSCVELFAGVN